MQECAQRGVWEARSGPSSAKAPVLDLEVLGTLRDLLPDSEISSIYSVFVRNTQERLATFRGPCDAARVAQEAHSLRGSAAMLGALVLASIAESLERHTTIGDLLVEHADAMEVALIELTAALAAVEVSL